MNGNQWKLMDVLNNTTRRGVLIQCMVVPLKGCSAYNKENCYTTIQNAGVV